MEFHSPINIIVARDLNIILDPKEKHGGTRDKDPFQEVVESLITEIYSTFYPRKVVLPGPITEWGKLEYLHIWTDF